MSDVSYFLPGWREALHSQGLRTPDDWWALPEHWVQEPNRDRGGFSAVSRHSLRGPDGQLRSVYVKRQRDYRVRTPWGYGARSVACREWQNLLRVRAMRVPAPNPVFFTDASGSPRRAILVTEALEGEPLEAWLSSREGTPEARDAVIEAARLLQRLHREGWAHGCFYPSHILVGPSGPTDLRLLDWEKARRPRLRPGRWLADLEAFCRRTDSWPASLRQSFWRTYLAEEASPVRARLLRQKFEEAEA